MTRAAIGSISPFFIVRDVSATIAFYESTLGFETSFRQSEDKPFFAILQRDGAMIFIKSGEAMPQPNATRDPEMRWDAYCYAPFSNPLNDTADGLRGFEITDPDGYVLFFGRPRER